MDSPRIDNEHGIPVFLEHGGISPYLKTINSQLLNIYQGMSAAEAMINLFTEMDLIEPVNLEITLNNGNKHNLSGNYTISDEKLAGLTGEKLDKLNKAGFLQSAFLIMTSINNVGRLITIKNRQ